MTDALRFKCDELGINTFCGVKITDIKKKDSLFTLVSTEQNFKCRAVLAAGGMLSGGEKLGCDGALYGVMKRQGFKVNPPSPSIVQVRTETDFVKQLKGIKVDANVSLFSDKKLIREDFGEVLFCDYGLSGPPVLQVSGFAREGDVISLDLMPEYSFDTLYNKLLSRKENLFARNNDEFLSGFFNKRLGQVVLKRAGIALCDSVKSLSDEKLEKICNVAKNFECRVLGDRGFINSQATRGGILTDEFYPETLMSKKTAGLFAAGEILDIVGDCGGFNLQWAWSSAFVAARGAVSFLERF